MASLIDTNPYLRDPAQRTRMIEEDVRQSSVFEGARGLRRAKTHGPRGGSWAVVRAGNRRTSVSVKKAASGS